MFDVTLRVAFVDDLRNTNGIRHRSWLNHREGDLQCKQCHQRRKSPRSSRLLQEGNRGSDRRGVRGCEGHTSALAVGRDLGDDEGDKPGEGSGEGKGALHLSETLLLSCLFIGREMHAAVQWGGSWSTLNPIVQKLGCSRGKGTPSQSCRRDSTTRPHPLNWL